MEDEREVPVKVGDIISTDEESVAIASEYEIWDEKKRDTKVVGKAVIRLAGLTNMMWIRTNWMKSTGLVCFLPERFHRCGILKVRITHLHKNSVEAVPVDYVKASNPLLIMFEGLHVSDILSNTVEFPDIKRYVIK